MTYSPNYATLEPIPARYTPLDNNLEHTRPGRQGGFPTGLTLDVFFFKLLTIGARDAA